METSILYVCTFWGARSRVAELFTNALEVPMLQADSAGFDNGRIGELPRRIVAERGLYLPEESPDNIFTRFRTGTAYDYIVILANAESQESYPTLLDTVRTLYGSTPNIIHWNVADFMSVTGEGNARVVAMREIIDDIERRVLNLVDEIEDANVARILPTVTAATAGPTTFARP
jgi:protein-tyrosine-phosphatase